LNSHQVDGRGEKLNTEKGSIKSDWTIRAFKVKLPRPTSSYGASGGKDFHLNVIFDMFQSAGIPIDEILYPRSNCSDKVKK
jgi:hypothetical protein